MTEQLSLIAEASLLSHGIFLFLVSLPAWTPAVLPLSPSWANLWSHSPVLTGELFPLWCRMNAGYHLIFCLFLLTMSPLPQCATSPEGQYHHCFKPSALLVFSWGFLPLWWGQGDKTALGILKQKQNKKQSWTSKQKVGEKALLSEAKAFIKVFIHFQIHKEV